MVQSTRIQLPESDLQHIVEHTGDIWKALDGASIFLTGGSGFIGRWLAESLVHAIDNMGCRASLMLLTRNPDAFRSSAPHLTSHPGVTLYSGEMTTFAFPATTFTHTIHAAIDHGEPSGTETAQSLYDRNAAGTRRVLDLAVKRGATRVLYLSSGAAYGPQPTELTHLPETYLGEPEKVITPRNWYCCAKRTSETLGEALASTSKVEFVTARAFAFVGPLLPFNANFAVGNFLRDALAGGPITIAGDGTPLRSYLYAADMAICLWTMLVKGQNSRVYNVGSADTISIRALAELVRDVVCPSAEVRVLEQAVIGAAPLRYVPDTTRAETELALRQWIDLPEALRRTAQWAQER